MLCHTILKYVISYNIVIYTNMHIVFGCMYVAFGGFGNDEETGLLSTHLTVFSDVRH